MILSTSATWSDTLLLSVGVATDDTRLATAAPSTSLASTSSWMASLSLRSTSSFRASRDTSSSYQQTIALPSSGFRMDRFHNFYNTTHLLFDQELRADRLHLTVASVDSVDVVGVAVEQFRPRLRCREIRRRCR